MDRRREVTGRFEQHKKTSADPQVAATLTLTGAVLELRDELKNSRDVRTAQLNDLVEAIDPDFYPSIEEDGGSPGEQFQTAFREAVEDGDPDDG